MDIIKPGFLDSLRLSFYYGSLITCSPSWGENDVVLPCCKIYYIQDGSCELKIGNLQLTGDAGKLFLIPAGVRHSFGLNDDNHVTKYWFHFTADAAGEPFFNLVGVPFMVNAGNDATLKALFDQVILNQKQETVAQAFRLKAAMLEILAFYFELAGNSATSSKTLSDINKVLAYINNNLHNRITTEDLAAVLHLHPNYFIRYFKSKTGLSPAKYINRLRLEKSKSLLENTDLPLSEIMKAVSFDDISHFSKYFKNATGYSPKSFRCTFSDPKNHR